MADDMMLGEDGLDGLEELLGALDLEGANDDLLGAARGVRSRALSRWRARNRAAVARAQASMPLPGIQAMGPRLLMVGFGFVTFNATSGTTLTMTAQAPQKPFQPVRLVAQAARTGTSATGLVSLSLAKVGPVDQNIGTGSIPIEAFAGDSQQNVLFDAAQPGVPIVLQWAVSAAPGSTDTIVVGAMLFGQSLA